MISPNSIQTEVPDANYWRGNINCQNACPVHTDARGYVRAIAAGDYERAYLIARGPNPLASICGRVCGAPCEAACRRGAIDQPIAIRALKRFASERMGQVDPLALMGRLLATQRTDGDLDELAGLREFLVDLPKIGPRRIGKRVAIIGSGPAGLGAAHDLALLGIEPVVFEMEPIPAGMLSVGIPAYRLPRELLQAEVDVIRALGTRFEVSTQVGKDITLAQIRKDFDATIIAVGAKRSRRLNVPGAGDDVLGAVELLRDIALGRPVPLGQRVMVVGGGNVAYDVSRSVMRQTGIDVSRTALRQAGVREVHLVSLESLEELPADDVEIIEGDEEGVIRHHRLGPRQILRDAGGRITGVEFHRVLRVFDENKRFAPLFDENTRTTIPVDTVVWAIGQQADLSFIPDGGDIRRTPRGLIECNQEELTTSAPDVFVAGDIAYGPKLLIHAVASGKQAARSVYRYVTGHALKSRQTMLHLPILNYRREPDYEKQPRVAVPTRPVEQRRHSQSTEVELPYSEQDARCDAGRCLDCGVYPIFDSDKCILCGGCADICPELCLRLVSVSALAKTDILENVLEARFDPGESDGASAIVMDPTQCIRCGLCAQRCPTGAITMERTVFDTTWSEVA